MKIQGTIKVLSFKGERVAIKLGDARFLTRDREWKEWNDWNAIEAKKAGKGEIWISSFKDYIYQACHEFEKGTEVEATVEENKGFWNIENIELKVPERDINEDMPPDAPFPTEEPSSDRREPDSPKAQAEKMVESATLDTKDTHIIRECCIYAVGYALNVADINKLDAPKIVALAKRLEKYVLEGK